MFINILGHDVFNKEFHEYLQYSGSTISLCFQEMLAIILILYVKYVHLSQLLDLSFEIIL